MRALSLFVDESGDFGKYEAHCPYYIFSMVFHDQDRSIKDFTTLLEDRLFYLGIHREHCFHTMPIIRKEGDYHEMSLPDRRKLLGYLLSYFRVAPIRYTSFLVEKKANTTVVDMTLSLSRQLAFFITQNWDIFSGYDKIIVYYDNGQIELTKVLTGILGSLLPHIEFRKIEPAQYRLFQVADLCCTMELIRVKKSNGSMSHSETIFFGGDRYLKKNYLNPMGEKRI